MPLSDAGTQSLEERNQLFTENMPLAYWALGHLLERHSGLKARLLRRYQWEDLEQVALFALLKSCAALDPARGALATLLTTTLRRDLLSAVRQADCRLLFASLTEKVEVSLAGPPAPLSAADREAVAHALAQLDEPSCLLVRRRFGFDAGREWNLEEIARALGVSKERVRQMERWALDRLAVVLAEGHAAASPGGPGHQDQPI
ncbi:MAG TPA: sigma-70 family RNA polymerase sigma factor [Gemmataceae bacterium]|nr:sigma-70 family RNA polymerase sigma factor [Gemmataceae bacterium]